MGINAKQKKNNNNNNNQQKKKNEDQNRIWVVATHYLCAYSVYMKCLLKVSQETYIHIESHIFKGVSCVIP